VTCRELRSRFGGEKDIPCNAETKLKEIFGEPLFHGDGAKKANQCGERKSWLEQIKARTGEHARAYEASWRCAYVVWSKSPNWEVLTSRWDAEALPSRSFLAFSIVLSSWSWVLQERGWLVFYLFLLLGSFFAFAFHRRKQLLGRFDLLLALSK
jgi:hypothetical protein